MRSVVGCILALILILSLVLIGCAAQPSPPPTEPLPSEIAIGTHPVGTSFHTAGSGIAKVLTENSPIKTTVKPYAGPAAYMPLLDKGALELGLPNLIEGTWAYTGGPGYPERFPNERLLMKGNYIRSLMGAVVREDSGIMSVRDLRGKRVTSEYTGTAMGGATLEVWLLSGGLTWDDIKPVPVTDFVSGYDALQQGLADACFGGAPLTAKVREVDAAIKIRPLPFEVSPESLKMLGEKLPGAETDTGKAGFGILREDVILIQYPIGLAASSLLQERAAYIVVETLWNNYKKLHPIYPAWLGGWSPETMFDPQPSIPYHPGAIAFYKEQEKWTAQMDEIQKQLLKQ